MAFSVNLLTNTAQCDALLTAKQRERADLVNDLANLNHQLATWDDATSTEAELATTTTLVAGLTPLVAGLPEGDEKRRNSNLLNRYETRVNNLTTKVENYGVIALLEKELDRDEVADNITVLDRFVAEVTARRAAL